MEHGSPEVSHNEIRLSRKAFNPSPMGLFSMTSALEGRAIPKLKSELNHVSNRIETKQNTNFVGIQWTMVVVSIQADSVYRLYLRMYKLLIYIILFTKV